MTLDEAKLTLNAKREQLIIYRDGLDGDSDVSFHARTMANGRVAQIEQDIITLNQITN